MRILAKLVGLFQANPNDYWIELILGSGGVLAALIAAVVYLVKENRKLKGEIHELQTAILSGKQQQIEELKKLLKSRAGS